MFSGLMKRLRAYAEKDGRGYPDWAIRYLPIFERLQTRDLEHRRILEIGANDNGFSRFAEVPVVAVDIALAHLRAARAAQEVTPVAGDLAALPFPDACFDICVCVDTFEHLPPHAREQAAREITRVLRTQGTAVISFPAGNPSELAEKRIREEYRELTGQTIPWLEEHVAYGLPDAREVFDFFHDLAGDTHRVTQTGNASLYWWEWMWRVLMCDWPGEGNAVFQVLLRWMTPWLSERHDGPFYRTMIWIEPKTENKT